MKNVEQYIFDTHPKKPLIKKIKIFFIPFWFLFIKDITHNSRNNLYIIFSHLIKSNK